MAFEPTKAQKRAIEENGNILVAAAAGSGKTAVLVERVIRKLCDNIAPVQADELLIVTFTNAAAAEMRARIEKSLDNVCRAHPNNPSLLKQKILLQSAKICTIDSFCIDLVRENFEKLGISPDFKIGEDTVLNKINQEVLYEIINRYIESGDKQFNDLLDIVGSEFDEKNFAELVLSLYEFSRQMPFPSKWFDSLADNYKDGFNRQNIWYQYSFEKAKIVVKSMKNQIGRAIDLITAVEMASDAYLTAFLDAAEKVATLEAKLDFGDWDEFYCALQNFSFLPLPRKNGMNAFASVVAAKDIYSYIPTKSIEKLKKFFYAEREFIDSQFKKLYPLIQLFINIVKEYETNVFEAYKQENLFTFHNTEHLALQLLCSEKDGIVTVNPLANEIIAQYKEIMVDEYQDTNDLQNLLFNILSNNDEKLFVVGDVKQSIYAFRGANPLNFLSKKNSHIDVENANETDPKKIVLKNNFRSCNAVCDYINYFFKMFMHTETGGIVYDSDEELVATAEFPETCELAVSVDIIDTKNAEENLVIEARRIADFIKETMHSSPNIRVDKNNLRNAKYGDFAILLRNVKNKAGVIVEELRKQGIPVNISINDFAESTEISTVLALLRVIDNPQLDIDLLTVMLSPIFGFSTDELAEIRAPKRDTSLFGAVIFSAQNGNQKCCKLLDTLKRLRLDSVTLPLPKLITNIILTTEYLNIVSAMADGEQRRNNLLLLCDYATGFVSDKISSPTAFAEYITQQSAGVSGGAAGNDSVKIMSIHASKGLQFPICIIADASSTFNNSQTRNSTAFSNDFGFGIKYYDEDDKQKYSTISREVILDKISNASLEEELRLLYVAMTRAQDKLMFVCSLNNYEKALQSYKNLIIPTDGLIDYSVFSRTNCYTDWLMISLLLHPDGAKLRESNDGVLPLDTESRVKIAVYNSDDFSVICESKDQTTFEPDADFIGVFNNNVKYVYPFDGLKNIRSKMSVSILANKAESDKFAFTARPSFMSSSGITATAKGTAMHKVMQFFDFSKYNDIDTEIERLYEWQFITENERNSLNKKALERFFASDIFARMMRSSNLQREMRFLTEIPANEIDHDCNIADENVIIQGAVDVCFVEDDGIVVLDFKTDRVEDIGDLADSYGEQLSLYATACEKIFGLKVKEKVIYSFEKSTTVTVK